MAATLRSLAPYLLKAGAAIAVLIGLWLYLQHVERAARADQKSVDSGAVETIQREQEIADLKRAIETERQRTKTTENRNDALSSRLADARADAAAYVERMRRQAAQGGGDGTDMPSVPGTAALAGGPGEDTDIPVADLEICAENTVKLQNARDWFRDQQKAMQ